ncbi:hypothetical protein disrupted by insertion of ISCg2e [Corynebacterium glutamicum MB001]|nr:hypothetical protein disrupted by insertion of ISCg2e [Corynebacterium glutamicum MB001]CAF20482.1 hypothetical protein disrupted by insertion of ISCg2e [Corynebacterium glutamicum ATCC 13032]
MGSEDPFGSRRRFKGSDFHMDLWCGWGAFRRLKVILKGLYFVTRMTGVIPVDALIKNSSRTCGQTIKSNEFLHIPLGRIQSVDAPTTIFSYTCVALLKPCIFRGR